MSILVTLRRFLLLLMVADCFCILLDCRILRERMWINTDDYGMDLGGELYLHWGDGV
jgi:hypothetical protein